MRALSLHFPHLATDLVCETIPELRGRPLVLVALEKNREVVVASSAAARVHPGTPLSEAASRTEGLLVRDYDAARTQEALLDLARWSYDALSPRVALDEDDGLIVDVGGSQRLHGGEAPILALARAHAHERRLEARFALADVPRLASALARFTTRGETIVAPDLGVDARRDVVAPLSARCLRLWSKIQRRLESLGVESVADVTRLPRNSLPARFGDRLGRHLDELIGLRDVPQRWLTFDAPPEHRMVFPDPGTTRRADLLTAATATTTELLEGLRRQDRALRLLTLEIEMEQDVEPMSFRFATPTCSAPCVQRVVAERLERIPLPLTPVRPATALRVVATETTRLRLDQLDLFADREASVLRAEVAQLLMRLELRLGSQRVVCLRPVADPRPERSVRAVPAAEHLCVMSRGRPTDEPARPACRPLRLLAQPQPLRVVLKDGAPVRIYEGGRPWAVTQVCREERLEAGWWEAGERSRRDYAILRNDLGSALWVFRDLNEDAYYLHGFFA